MLLKVLTAQGVWTLEKAARLVDDRVGASSQLFHELVQALKEVYISFLVLNPDPSLFRSTGCGDIKEFHACSIF